MKRKASVFVGWWGCVTTLSIVCLGLPVRAYSQVGIALIVQQTPAEGGTVTPPEGTHYFAPDSEVALFASPKSGYRFVCWLGDVYDPRSSRTITYLDTAKIVVAVFERILEDSIPGGGGSSGGGSQGAGGGGGVSSLQELRPATLPPLFPPPPRPPPPPPQTAEPSTVFLLGLGAVMLSRRRRLV